MRRRLSCALSSTTGDRRLVHLGQSGHSRVPPSSTSHFVKVPAWSAKDVLRVFECSPSLPRSGCTVEESCRRRRLCFGVLAPYGHDVRCLRLHAVLLAATSCQSCTHIVCSCIELQTRRNCSRFRVTCVEGTWYCSCFLICHCLGW